MPDQSANNQTSSNNSLLVAQAIGALNKTLSGVFPQSSGVTGSAGAATGTYLTVLAPDGNSYKIALLAIS